MSTEISSAPADTPYEVTTAEDWKNVLCDPILPSARRVVFRWASLSELITLDALPDELRELVTREWAIPGSAAAKALEPYTEARKKASDENRDITDEELKQAETESQKVADQVKQMNRELIALALVQPKMTAEELLTIPRPDLEMLAGLLNRTIAHDASGRRVGVVPLDWFRVFSAAHGLDCAPDCPDCLEAGWAVSALLR